MSDDILVDSGLHEDYFLRKWADPNVRSPIGIICTIGPKVYDPSAPDQNKITDLVERGMNIARINLSHYPLDPRGQPDPDRFTTLARTILEIRRVSDITHRPVCIMLDTKGPEFRVSGFRIQTPSQLVSERLVTIKKGDTLHIARHQSKGPLRIAGPLLCLRGSRFSDLLAVPKSCQLRVLQTGSGGSRGTTVDLARTGRSGGVCQTFVVTSITPASSTAVVSAKSQVQVLANRSRGAFLVEGIYSAALATDAGSGGVSELALFAPMRNAPDVKGATPSAVVYVEYEGNFTRDIRNQHIDDPIYVENGEVGLRIKRKPKSRRDYALVLVDYGKSIELRKSMNLYNNARRSMSTAYATSDKVYIERLLREFSCKPDECPFDAIAVSFVRRPGDLRDVRRMLTMSARNRRQRTATRGVCLIAKIESPHCFMKTDSAKEHFLLQEHPDFSPYLRILGDKECWGVMIARGDLGAEIEPEKVPEIQRKLTEYANAAGKSVVVATQMMLSMMKKLRPSRADVTDVHNAVLCGADTVMLSEETAGGENPVRTLEYMRKIVDEAARVLVQEPYLSGYRARLETAERVQQEVTPKRTIRIMELLGKPMVDLSRSTESPAIFSYAFTGSTITSIPRYRPDRPIIAIAASELIARNLLFYYGIYPLWIEERPRPGIDSRNHEPDFPRNPRDYRRFICNIIRASKDNSAFRFDVLEKVKIGSHRVLFGTLGVDARSTHISDRAIVVFKYC